MPTGLVYSDRFLDHDTGPGHPERPARLGAIMDSLRTRHLLERMMPIPFGPADLKWILRLHDRAYVDRLQAACASGARMIDTPDSAICPASYDVALLAAGGVIAAAEAVFAGTVRNAFCVVRPPGHHAERDRSMGFCLFNNVAVAAEYLIAHHGLERVAIIDFDVHHGNGTQHLFESRKDVFYISLHEHPDHQYPGTGYAHETGSGEEHGEGGGAGFTLNLPVLPGQGDDEYRRLFHTKVVPALDAYRPQAVILSAGFDACRGDPLARIELTPQGLQWMTRQLKGVAERWGRGRLVSVLEGGYSLRNLAECAALHVEALLEPEGHDGMMAMKAGF
ncbi:MAG: histone deacetylase [Planctomycetota bacterium]|nr:histone deacetylase [Planctomycetota bacterium]